MSKGGKITLGVVVVVLIAGAIWWASSMSNGYSPAPASPSASTNPTNVSDSASNNQSLSQEMTSVDTQLNGLSSDSAKIDQSLNDQPVSQN